MINRITRKGKFIWQAYKTFVHSAIHQPDSEEGVKDISYWREIFFTNCILYSLPFSLIAFVPSVIITYERGLSAIPVVSFLTLFSVIFICLNRRFSLLFRKAFVVTLLYALGIFLTIYFGDFGIGTIFILAVSVFIALLFRSEVVYGSVLLNFVIYGFLAAEIKFGWFSWAVNRYDPAMWIVYTSNFLFLNTIIIVQIRNVIGGLENTLMHEQQLLVDLQTEIEDKVKRNEQLKESETHYKSLFLLNPSPMWIYNVDTLQFLQVNEAATLRYGYTEEEFLSMSIKDIRSNEKIEELQKILQLSLRTNTSSQNITQHRTKDGKQFYVEVICNPIKFKGKHARLVITRNIHAQIEYTRAIQRQNNKLQNIAYIQSHVVRAPLARILGLTQLIKDEPGHESRDPELINYLDTSVKELDDIVKSIISNTEDILPEEHPTIINPLSINEGKI
ncbi:PAS domain S-box protein [Mucilaginibacter sp. RS28]|uniref:histidine kinase n=1 Tax=Mucilaginibacter straminoryzae TaxID=2932774 RepID=A0A9X1X6A7_9SPHI|nr:PAS domain S-box protein [Mucilaginibacter straminoryzae]MCJ8211130.1 PAS domain S-box protein [Mucilaginibacter straminoryzae]